MPLAAGGISMYRASIAGLRQNIISNPTAPEHNPTQPRSSTLSWLSTVEHAGRLCRGIQAFTRRCGSVFLLGGPDVVAAIFPAVSSMTWTPGLPSVRDLSASPYLAARTLRSSHTSPGLRSTPLVSIAAPFGQDCAKVLTSKQQYPGTGAHHVPLSQ